MSEVYRCTVDGRDSLLVEVENDGDVEFLITSGRLHQRTSVFLNVADVKKLHNQLADVLDKHHEGRDAT